MFLREEQGLCNYMGHKVHKPQSRSNLPSPSSFPMYLHFIHKDLTFHAVGASLSNSDTNSEKEKQNKTEKAGREKKKSGTRKSIKRVK